jgi:hypothetical protein
LRHFKSRVSYHRHSREGAGLSGKSFYATHGMQVSHYAQSEIVMTGRDPVIHVIPMDQTKTWIRGSSPRMTIFGRLYCHLTTISLSPDSPARKRE